MKLIKIVLYLFLGFFVSSLNAQNFVEAAPVYWVHGLGGSPAKWNAYAPHFEKRHKISLKAGVNSIRPSYNSRSGLFPGAAAVASSMDPLKPEGIVISHSMGGLVTRFIANNPPNNQSRFAGYVAINSSNAGAFIGNSVLNGSVEKLIDWGIIRLSAGPIANFFSSTKTGGILAGVAVGGVTAFDLTDGILSLNETIGGSLNIREGTVDIAILNGGFQSNMPKVALHGVEQEPVLWRIVNQVTDDPANADVDQYHDDFWPQNAGGLQSLYYMHSAVQAVAGVVNLFWNPPLAIYNFAASAAWVWGATWFDHANDEWHWIIGATHYGVVSYTTQVFICDEEPDTQVRALCYNDCANNNNEGCYREEVITYKAVIHGPSDGVVTLASQEALPGKLAWTRTSGPNDPSGCGHQEARNHIGTTKALNDIFDGAPHPIFKRNR